MKLLLEEAKIGEGAGELDAAVLGGGHGEVDAEKAGREDEEDPDGGAEFPAVEREPLRFRLLGSGGVVLQHAAAVLEVPQEKPPGLGRRHAPRRRHRRHRWIGSRRWHSEY